MKYLASLFTLLIVSAIAVAQDDGSNPWRMYLNGNFQLGIPQQDFKENLDRIGIGGGGLLLFQLGKMPLYAGAEFSGMSYDRESNDYVVNVGGFLKDYELRTSNSIFMMHGMLRVQPNINGPVRPYIDGMVGTKNLYTRTRLIEEDDNGNPDDNQEESRIERGDWAFSYGGALGIQFDVSRSQGILLDLRCAFLPGGNATYLVRKPGDNVNYDEPIDAFEEKSSPTTLLMPQIGLTFLLSSFSDSDSDDY
ncbi:MAG: hypothetical protein HUU01_14685 [Saprospiraceae bacterium]|nr:hypothetical protein [Saprospiraceae bacterium]